MANAESGGAKTPKVPRLARMPRETIRSDSPRPARMKIAASGASLSGTSPSMEWSPHPTPFCKSPREGHDSAGLSGPKGADVCIG
eukprot:4369506-Pyramimonas_sp.AAC.1